MAITIDTVGNALGQFCVKHSDKVNQALRMDLEFEKDLPKRKCDHSYQGHDVTHTDVIQPYQKNWTPNNSETLGGELSVLEIGKVDLTYDLNEMQKFWTNWDCDVFEAGKNPLDWTFPKYMMTQVIPAKITEEMNEISWKGSYVAPTPGTAGAFLTTFTGYGQRFAQAITDGKLVPIATGLLVDSTMVQQVKDFCKQIPLAYRGVEGILEMSYSNALRYADDYQVKYPSREVVEKTPDRQYMRVDHVNIKISPRKSMEGSDRFVLRFPKLDSMIVGIRDGYPSMPTFRVDVEKRDINFLAEFYRFYNVETFTHMFVNDQA